MTSALAQIPLAVGASAAGLASRAAVWSANQFLRSPVAATGLILVSGLTLMAATNAVFLQEERHPAPLFVSGAANSAPIRPVVVEPESIPQRPAPEPAAERTPAEPAPQPQPEASAEPEPAAQAQAPAIGNQDIAELQEKLQALGLFNGTVDGYYGPNTADAIRAFESRFNLPRTGAATPQVIEAVRNAPLQTSEAPAPAPSPSVAAEPTTDEIAPLVARMQEEAASAPSEPAAQPTQERQTVADISPDVPAPAPAPAEAADPDVPPALDRDLVSDIQRGLSRLGFLQAPVNGVADEATARAIRQFQIFNNYRPTGEVSPMLRQMLVEAGAYL
ncbi:peptidoglycan-binding domain-containing protein [Pelagibacterium sp. H642]|uniref:peptidoglycan-binding domain-containing protein n=1 Tax=Pelagibacterium sp. H642 TaxID=1881069 RepID=UPI00281542AE|nr:peptidoglycan-binding domain-containing protein [Pelagibacterium sp. H642]WMT91242.1 peptidoglycan-binding protein [Pelagibacterium sp. H642]